MVHTTPEIEADLAEKFEGKLFEHLWLAHIGEEWHVMFDRYTVRNGIVFLIYEGNRLAESQDKMVSLLLECVMVGDYDANTMYSHRAKPFQWAQLKKALGVEK